jgi:tetratricopeptide (TPR) repeat protein
MIWLLALQLAVTPAQHYENAKQDFAQRKFSEAVNEVNIALHESPYMVPALVLKARLAIFAHHADVAKSCLITAVTADPESEEAQFFLGVFYYNQNDFSSAISPLEKAQALSPSNPMPVFYLAMAHESVREVPQALDLYQKAEDLSLEKSPQKALILLAYGRFLMMLGRTQDGIEKVRQSIQIDPQSRQAHFALAIESEQEEDFKNAAREAALALTLPDLGTSDAQIYFLLSRIYTKLKQPDLAKTYLDKYKAETETTLK